ncbi:hypothetical protein DOLIC_00028 [Dolichomitus sp. PSUC_FEM 10030005]|nr:hypothetical protein [Dolichomitus sp. PSUC_FEM 10030005]
MEITKQKKYKFLSAKNRYDIRCFENNNLISTYQYEAYHRWHREIFPNECLRIVKEPNVMIHLDELLAYSDFVDKQMNVRLPGYMTDDSIDENEKIMEDYATSVYDIDTASTDFFNFIFEVAGKYRAFTTILNRIIKVLQRHWHFELWGLLPNDLTFITGELAHSAENFFAYWINEKKILALNTLKEWLSVREIVRTMFLRIRKQIIPAFLFYDMTVIKTYVSIIHDYNMPEELLITTKSAQRLLNIA